MTTVAGAGSSGLGILLAGLALAVAACSPTQASPSPTTGPIASGPPAGSPGASGAAVTCAAQLKVGLVTSAGPVTDQGFNQSAYEGMAAARTEAPTCFDTDAIETEDPADWVKNIAAFTEGLFDVVIGVGPPIANSIGDAAAAYPDIQFLTIDGGPSGCPPGSTPDCVVHDSAWATNGVTLLFAEDQAGYLAGVLAASMSKTGHVGVVGGVATQASAERYVEGFVNGARSVKPEIIVDVLYATSYDDAPQGSDAAKVMIGAGADVIFGAAGLTGNGALSAACESANVFAIGVDTDQYVTTPELGKCLLSSAVKNVRGAVRDALLRIASDQFQPGGHVDTAATGGVGLAPFHDFDAQVPQTVKDLVDTTLAGLADGSIATGVTVDGVTEVPATGPTT